MKFRAICFGLLALVSLTPGCYWRHPCFGFRLHPCATMANGSCCSSPIRNVMHSHRAAIVAPSCPSCIGGGAMVAPPVSYSPVGYPGMPYPPVIGQPIPLPGGPTVIPSHELPNPMPVKPSGY